MSKVDLKDANGAVFKAKTHEVDDGGQSSIAQGVVLTDAATGDPASIASETTLQALATAVGTLNTLSDAIKTALESLNGKTEAVNTSSIAGIVALDSATLSALESISANTGLEQPLTDAQLRATAIPVAPVGSSTEETALATMALVEAVSKMNEAMQYLMTSILEKMPRVDAADRLLVSHAESSPAVTLAANQTLQTLATLTAIGGRDAAHTAYALANVGALHLYDNIRVS